MKWNEIIKLVFNLTWSRDAANSSAAPPPWTWLCVRASQYTCAWDRYICSVVLKASVRIIHLLKSSACFCSLPAWLVWYSRLMMPYPQPDTLVRARGLFCKASKRTCSLCCFNTNSLSLSSIRCRSYLSIMKSKLEIVLGLKRNKMIWPVRVSIQSYGSFW